MSSVVGLGPETAQYTAPQSVAQQSGAVPVVSPSQPTLMPSYTPTTFSSGMLPVAPQVGLRPPQEDGATPMDTKGPSNPLGLYEIPRSQGGRTAQSFSLVVYDQNDEPMNIDFSCAQLTNLQPYVKELISNHWTGYHLADTFNIEGFNQRGCQLYDKQNKNHQLCPYGMRTSIVAFESLQTTALTFARKQLDSADQDADDSASDELCLEARTSMQIQSSRSPNLSPRDRPTHTSPSGLLPDKVIRFEEILPFSSSTFPAPIAPPSMVSPLQTSSLHPPQPSHFIPLSSAISSTAATTSAISSVAATTTVVASAAISGAAVAHVSPPLSSAPQSVTVTTTRASSPMVSTGPISSIPVVAASSVRSTPVTPVPPQPLPASTTLKADLVVGERELAPESRPVLPPKHHLRDVDATSSADTLAPLTFGTKGTIPFFVKPTMSEEERKRRESLFLRPGTNHISTGQQTDVKKLRVAPEPRPVRQSPTTGRVDSLFADDSPVATAPPSPTVDTSPKDARAPSPVAAPSSALQALQNASTMATLPSSDTERSVLQPQLPKSPLVSTGQLRRRGDQSITLSLSEPSEWARARAAKTPSPPHAIEDDIVPNRQPTKITVVRDQSPTPDADTPAQPPRMFPPSTTVRSAAETATTVAGVPIYENYNPAHQQRPLSEAARRAAGASSASKT